MQSKHVHHQRATEPLLDMEGQRVAVMDLLQCSMNMPLVGTAEQHMQGDLG
jgi:hypothetical protein